MNIKKLAFLGLTILLASSTLAAQSLGDVARQQREKRGQDAKKVAKVYTNENMPARPAEEGATAAAGISAGAPAQSTKSESGEPSFTSTAANKTPQTATPTASEKAEDKIKTKDYWQGRFKAARAQLTSAQEEQQLVQDEFQLLQIQQAREINPDVQKEVAEKMTAKKAELDAKSAATARVQKDLADLDQEFKDSGAPDEWSKTD